MNIKNAQITALADISSKYKELKVMTEDLKSEYELLSNENSILRVENAKNKDVIDKQASLVERFKRISLSKDEETMELRSELHKTRRILKITFSCIIAQAVIFILALLTMN